MTVHALPAAVWAKIAAEFMDRAADEFGNHGCNDFDLSTLGLSREDQVTLVAFMNERNGSPEETPGDIERLPWTSDFCVMFACAAWLRSLAVPLAREATGPIGTGKP